MNYKLSYPAVNGEVVTEGHTAYCAEHGHGTHTVDGVILPICPRCGVDKNKTTYVLSALTEEQALDMGITEAAVRQASTAALRNAYQARIGNTGSALAWAARKPLEMAIGTVELTNWEKQGSTKSIIANRVEMKYLGKFWWSV